jgi:hypothetical protein
MHRGVKVLSEEYRYCILSWFERGRVPDAPPPSHNYRYIVCQNKQHEISAQTSKGEEHKCKSFTYECDIFRARQQTLYIPHLSDISYIQPTPLTNIPRRLAWHDM